MKEGTIFNIQKFSLHDGPGIRTTVFFKGCPLKCLWCANPESQSFEKQILIDHDQCVHCLACVHTCPNHAIHVIDHMIKIDHHHCTSCLTCANTCPRHALSIEGDTKTIEEITHLCLQDIDFYEESGGGVTLSGGEAMSQPFFLKELVSSLKEHKIHIAIETTGYINDTLFKELAPLFDLILFDIKHHSSKMHKVGTGVSNELILSNLKWALEQKLNIIIRIPVIPDYNDSLDDARQFADTLSHLQANQIQLLPFHQYGEKKYELLNLSYHYKNKKALYEEDLKDYLEVFIEKGLNCYI